MLLYLEMIVKARRGEISHGWEILSRDGAYMEIENIIRYAPRAVGLKPSAMQGEARLCGL